MSIAIQMITAYNKSSARTAIMHLLLLLPGHVGLDDLCAVATIQELSVIHRRQFAWRHRGFVGHRKDHPVEPSIELEEACVQV